MTDLISVRPGEAGFATLRFALAAAHLAVDDLNAADASFFMLPNGAGRPIAFAGLEGAGADQLLRSVVVDPAHRMEGLGRQVVLAIEDEARARGARALWLLTTDAASFFGPLGYAPADRATTPAAIGASAQLRGLCPASAALLRKSLDDAA